tara:strand:- start:673 stop:1452 length:780 start_codon:yes stop_codon:yes gene_type:complete
MHSGKPKKLSFDIGKFKNFKDKIIYIVVNEQPKDLLKINSYDDDDTKQKKMTDNAKKREMYQINKATEGLKDASADDIILISDLDEIPNLENLNFEKINKKIFFFKQKMYYYKLNLLYESFDWYGSKACKKKHLSSPENLRSSKNKSYSFWRLDVLFSKIKHNSVYFVNNGGWHFSNIKSPEDLEIKMLNFLHHVDYEQSGLTLDDLKKLIREKKVMYDHSIDKRGNKWREGKKLKKSQLKEMPEYVIKNISKYKKWID